MRKSLIIALLGILPFTSSYALASQLVEIEGDKAKDILTNGKVLGISLFEEGMKKDIGVRMGFVYRVIHNGNFWSCYSWEKDQEEVWFCDSRQ
jgi:hypothetical protein